MKVLNATLERIEQELAREPGFVPVPELGKGFFRVLRVDQVKRRPCYLVLDGVESPSRCCFTVHCYLPRPGTFDRDYPPIDLPDEVADKEEAAFNVTLLEERHGVCWSLFNDKLDRQWDGVFKGSDERIQERADQVVDRVLQIVRNSLIPFLEKLEGDESAQAKPKKNPIKKR